jgi:dTDP-glucose 4,6-dehydratase
MDNQGMRRETRTVFRRFTNSYKPQRILVTGGLGFIGSELVWMVDKYPHVPEMVILDLKTYAACAQDKLEDCDITKLLHGDIRDPEIVKYAMEGCDAVINFAAESHVDRSIMNAADFVSTNTVGTQVLVDEAVRLHKAGKRIRFVQVSTDEVMGSCKRGQIFNETTPLNASNPYAASKAGAEQLVHAAHVTHGLDTIITRGCNTFGPWQHPEKFLPYNILRAMSGQPMRLYGDGRHQREWIHVYEHADGIYYALQHGKSGEIYCISSGQIHSNLSVAKRMLKMLGLPPTLIEFTTDRPGHDRRYHMSSRKLRRLGWKTSMDFQQELRGMRDWYARQSAWCIKAIEGSAAYFAEIERERQTIAFVRAL